MSDEHLFPLRPKTVLAVVADAYAVSPAQLASPAKRRPLGEARGLAARLLHDECRLSWVQVTALLGLQPSTRGHLTARAQQAPAERLAALRGRLYPNGHQPPLWE